MRSEISYVQRKHNQEIEQLNSVITKTEVSQKSLVSENQRFLNHLKETKLENENIEEQIRAMKLERESMINRYELSQREIEGIRSSDKEWEDSLTRKIKDLQRQKE